MSNMATLAVLTHEAVNDNYLAGYFDAKATLYMSTGLYQSAPQLRLQIRSISREVADFIMQTYDAGRLTESNTKYVVSSRPELCRLLTAVYPYLLMKQELVATALRLLEAQNELEVMRSRRVVGYYDAPLETEIRLAKRAMYDVVDEITAINDSKD